MLTTAELIAYALIALCISTAAVGLIYWWRTRPWESQIKFCRRCKQVTPQHPKLGCEPCSMGLAGVIILIIAIGALIWSDGSGYSDRHYSEGRRIGGS